MTAIIAIVGRSKTGKTTLVEKLIPELTARGHKIATVKNTFHRIEFDVPGSDTWRHIKAGSAATAICSADTIMLIKKTKSKSTLEDVIKLFNDEYDLLIIEGFKESNLPKIEVHRKEIGPPLMNLRNLLAIATDEDITTEIPQFSLGNIKEMTQFIEDRVIRKE